VTIRKQVYLWRWAWLASLFVTLTATAQQRGQSPVHPRPSNPQLASPEIERRVNALLSRMSLEEKLGQLVQYSSTGTTSATKAATAAADLATNPEAQYRVDAMQLASDGRLGSMLNVTGGARIASYQHAAVEKSRLHIPLLFGADVIHGYRTIYPIPLGLAASFDPQLVEGLSHMAAQEATTAGIRWFYSPMVDISRDARWGRSAEGAGEDPFLGAAMARAYVRGYQGAALSAPDSVAASVKHFAAYGAVEAGREYNTTDMSESRLFQVYLPPYKAAVEAGTATVMSAFNALNGVPATANPYLLNNVLRQQWGFNGFVVSDYTAIMELLHHGVALDAATATAKAINAGVDVDMMSHFYDTQLPALIHSGRVPMSVVDEAVRRVLRVKFALGLFEHPYSDVPEITSAVAEHRPAVLQAAEESFVLLENKQVDHHPVLPLDPKAKIALIGPLADAANEMQGAWGGAHRGTDVVTLRQAFEESAANKGTTLLYAPGTEINGNSNAGFADAEKAAKDADVVVMALGESSAMSGEAGSRAHLTLPGNQQALLERIVAIGKPVVLLVFSGRPLVLAWAHEHVDGILEAWFPGTEAGHALTAVLYGDVSPSGRLPMSFPRTEGQEPLYYNQFPTGRPAMAADLTTPPGPATRFISRYIDVPNDALYPFGYGLSYTTFDYGDVKLSRTAVLTRDVHDDGRPLVTVTATVRNTGTKPSGTVVQCYVGNRGDSLEQPIRSLKGIKRVTLAPGETQTVTFPLRFGELAFFDNAGQERVEPSDYTVWVGGDSGATSSAHFIVER
jgi:beta-glucosidase